MKQIINLNKPISITPLEAVKKFQKKNPEYKNKKIGYAGRLDPMAEGILLLLIEDKNKEITKYMNLDKTYKAKVLFGFSTDSFDILGLPKKAKAIPEKNKDFETNLKKQIKKFKGTQTQKLPPYSSYRIKGKPLFHYARENKLSEIKIPNKKVEIKSISLNSLKSSTSQTLLKQIQTKIKKLKGNFRQKQIQTKWKQILQKQPTTKYLIAEITISCSSGTYIRTIANDLGKKLNTSAILLNLQRTKLGKYNIKNSIKI
ncbi:hypothetical protein HOD75_03790 [archaeon]|jgi:tRNA pseudouridine55 synthase|nr:hypothetical protein [archaeon]MBT4241992.1 hypothetical protein [archaeon]MBT4418539.1 hypothetical protein [archaeon]